MTHTLAGINLTRVLVIGLLALVTSMVLVVLVVFGYAFMLGFEVRGQPDQTQIRQFAKTVAPWLGPILAAVLSACGAAWLAARVQMRLALHGLLVGAVVALGVLGIELSQGIGPADVAKVLPIVGAAWLAGVVVARLTTKAM
jgi:hypothetical protein